MPYLVGQSAIRAGSRDLQAGYSCGAMVQGTTGPFTPSGLPPEGQAMHLAPRTGPSASGRLTMPPRRMAMQPMGCSSSLPTPCCLGERCLHCSSF